MYNSSDNEHTEVGISNITAIHCALRMTRVVFVRMKISRLQPVIEYKVSLLDRLFLLKF
jgi:hypothetical protein